MTNSGFGSFRHLAVRFFGALDPRGPSPEEEAWATGWLLPGEIRLWRHMSGPDRRHAAGVARDTARLLGRPVGRSGDAGGPPRPVMAAALLHDVGKIESGFGTFSRVAITLAAMVDRSYLAAPGRTSPDSGRTSPDSGGASPDSGRTSSVPRWRVRVADYLTHDRIGARLLEQAGSDPLTICWTREHHQPAHTWTLEPELANALKEADGD